MKLGTSRATARQPLLAHTHPSIRRSDFYLPWSVSRGQREVFGLVLLAAAAVAAITLQPPSVSESAPARAAVETTAVLVAALAACLLYARARAGGRGRVLTMAWGVGLFVAVEAALSLLPAIVSQQVDGALLEVDALARLLIGVVLAVAALAPARLIDRAGRRTAYAMGAAVLAILTALIVIVALHRVDPSAALAAASPPAGQAATYLAAALVAIVAGAAFAVRAARDATELAAWIAAAVVLLGGAHLAAAINPVPSPQWITTGDLLRCAAALILLAGALRQRGGYLTAAARRAVAEERRRIARVLHDGLAQELAYIAAHAPRLAAGSDDPAAPRLAAAAASALDESRLAIASLADEPDEPLGRALARTAEQIAARAGGVVRVELQDGVEVEPAVRSDLLRIVREATTNAVRHGGASEVLLSLTGGETVILRIADDGVGFQADGGGEGPYSGFGLTSMRERAERAGGRLRVRSEPGCGTVIEVRIA
jgi:signal transduction histidine kinase